MDSGLQAKQRTTLSTARVSHAILAVILSFVGVASGIIAIAKPFWFDEVATVIVSRLPGPAAIVKALAVPIDANPPLFYFISAATRQLAGSDHIGYRMPGILGLMAVVLFLHLALSRKVDHLSALTGSAFVLTTQIAAYGYEARPYGLMLGLLAGTILAWQSLDGSVRSCVLFAAGLASAISVHYYAILVWPAFVLAEATVWLFYRRFRAGAWLALLAGLVPLAFSAPLILSVKRTFGGHFWSTASPGMIIEAPDGLLGFNLVRGHGAAVVILATLAVGYVSMRQALSMNGDARRRAGFEISDSVLTVVLMWLPAIAVIAALVTHGGMTIRYMMPTVLGAALAVGYLASRLPRSVRVVLLVLFVSQYFFLVKDVFRSQLRNSLSLSRNSATREFGDILARYPESGLPVVVSNGIRYLPMAFYTPANLANRLYTLTDPVEAVKSTGTDSVDLGLLALGPYSQLNVVDYAGFVSAHKEFLLLGGGDDPRWDWWPARLKRDGHEVRVLSKTEEQPVYLVTIRP